MPHLLTLDQKQNRVITLKRISTQYEAVSEPFCNDERNMYPHKTHQIPRNGKSGGLIQMNVHQRSRRWNEICLFLAQFLVLDGSSFKIRS